MRGNWKRHKTKATRKTTAGNESSTQHRSLEAGKRSISSREADPERQEEISAETDDTCLSGRETEPRR